MRQRPLEIRSEVMHAFDELCEVEWFRRVGHALPKNALAVGTWAEAAPYVDKLESENVRIEAANGIRLVLLEKQKLGDWNQVVELIRPVAGALVTEKAKPTIDRLGWGDSAFATARWDVLHLGLEVHYAEVVEPSFYLQLAYWYREGHFPMGWEGPVNGGKPVVY